MTSKTRRPHGLIAQAQEHLRNTQAAHRQALQQAAGSSASSSALASCAPPRPPQLPGGGYPQSPLGTPSQRAAEDLRACSATPSSRGSRTRTKQGRALSQDAPPPKSPQRSPSSSSGRNSPRGVSGSERSARADEEQDEALQRELSELEELSCRLGLRSEEPDPRPATGSSPSWASSSARRGSRSGRASPEDEPPASEAGPDGVAKRLPAVVSDDPLDTLSGAPRAAHELRQCRLPHGCRIEESACSSAQLFLTIDVAEGPYTPATLTFWIKIFDEFPEPGSVSVRCTQRIFHPSVEASTSRVAVPDDCFNGGLKPLNALFACIRQLVLTPADASAAANPDAAALLRKNPEEFRRTVRFTLLGGEHRGVQYERVLNTAKEAERPASSSSLPAAPPREPLSGSVKVDIMKLEVMRDQVKSQLTSWQQDNQRQIGDLEQ
mmetsp:Transcript_67309/g.217313  ORF Transcript_67309/g.217313 Transcript_67309/m.217313 type:complete len:437 (-) Transcript_67309:85-1395(-)